MSDLPAKATRLTHKQTWGKRHEELSVHRNQTLMDAMGLKNMTVNYTSQLLLLWVSVSPYPNTYFPLSIFKF